MPLAGDAKEVGDMRTGRMHNTAMGACTKQLWHWGGRSAPNLLFHYWDSTCRYVQRFEEVPCGRRIDDILSNLGAIPFP